MPTTTFSPRVPALAQLLSHLRANELLQLTELVPSLRVAPSKEDAELAEHVRQLAASQNIAPIASDDEPFIGGLTYAQYFALSEAEQDAFWEQLFTDHQQLCHIA
jgi:hypothetical protein